MKIAAAIAALGIVTLMCLALVLWQAYGWVVASMWRRAYVRWISRG